MSKFKFYLTIVALIVAIIIAFIKKLYLIAPLGIVGLILHILSFKCIDLKDEEELKKCMIITSLKSLIVIIFVTLFILMIIKK